MNGTKPKFLEHVKVPASYYEKPNPYVNAPSCHVNLLEMSRYAKRNGKLVRTHAGRSEAVFYIS